MDTGITLRKLEIFELVADLQSVSRAADKLWLAQPVVTSHIRSLEEKLGVTLFRRQARGMELTEAGAAVLVWAADVLRRTAEVSRDLDGLTAGTTGSIVMGASISLGSYGLVPALSAFRRERPSVSVKLDVDYYRNVIDNVESSANDFGVIVSPSDPVNRQLTSERIGTDELVAIGPLDAGFCPSHLDREEFSSLPFIEIANHAAMGRELHRAGLRPRDVTIDLGHPEAVKRAVQDGLGVSVLFRSAVASELAAGTLRELKIEGVDLSLNVYIIHRIGKRFAPAHEELLRQIRASFRPGTRHAVAAPS